jgi:hypothetical protein
LIGDDFDSAFTDWLFYEVDRISHGSNQYVTIDPTNQMQDEPMEDTTHHYQQISDPSQTTPSRRSRKSPATSARSAAAPYPQPTRMVDQINRALERPQVKHSIPDLPNVPTGPRSQSSAGPIRSRGRGGPPRAVMPPSPLDFNAFLIANGMPAEFFQQMMAAGGVNFPGQVFPTGMPGGGLADRISDKNADGSSGIHLVGGDKARCRHWPRCQLGARCKFHHPSQICPYYSTFFANKSNRARDYPNCPHAAGTCPNIHVGEDIQESELNTVIAEQLGTGKRPVNGHNNPMSNPNGHGPRREKQPPKPKQTPKSQELPLCKFGIDCTKPDCPFAHPNPTAGKLGLVLSSEWCPDGRNCLNQEVPAPPLHPFPWF